MKQKFLLKTMLLLSALVVGSSNVWADDPETLVSGSGSSGYAVPDGWSTSGTVEGGSYLKFDNGTMTSSSFGPHTSLSFTYTVATFGSGTNHPLTIRILNASTDAVIVEKTTATPTSSSYISTDSPIDLGDIGVNFKIQLYAPTGKGIRLRNYSVTGIPDSGGSGTTPSNLALTGDPITLNFDLYNNKSAQEIAYTTSSTGAVSVVSNDYVNATVNTETKKISITPKKVTGSAQTITVRQAADETYAAGEQTFKVNITDSTPTETFEKITSAADLATGDELIFVYEKSGEDKAAGTIGSNAYLASVGVTIDSSSGTNKIGVKSGDGVNVFVLCDDTDGWTLYSKMDNGYLYSSAAKSVGIRASQATWTISINSTKATITTTAVADNSLQYNSGSPRFCAYTSSQASIQIYRKVVGRTALSVGATGYTTYVTKKNVSFPSGVSAYIVTAANTSSVTLTEVVAAPVNTALVIEAAEGDYNLTEEDAKDCDDVSGNLLYSSNGYIEGNESNIYALGKKSSTVGFYLVKSGVKVPAGKAFIEISGGGVKEFLTFDFGENPDGIKSLTPALSEGEGEIYNLAGQRISKMQKGINIVNGKKILF